MSPPKGSRNLSSTGISVLGKGGQARTRSAPPSFAQPDRQENFSRTRRVSPHVRAKGGQSRTRSETPGHAWPHCPDY